MKLSDASIWSLAHVLVKANWHVPHGGIVAQIAYSDSGGILIGAGIEKKIWNAFRVSDLPDEKNSLFKLTRLCGHKTFCE